MATARGYPAPGYSNKASGYPSAADFQKPGTGSPANDNAPFPGAAANDNALGRNIARATAGAFLPPWARAVWELEWRLTYEFLKRYADVINRMGVGGFNYSGWTIDCTHSTGVKGSPWNWTNGCLAGPVGGFSGSKATWDTTGQGRSTPYVVSGTQFAIMAERVPAGDSSSSYAYNVYRAMHRPYPGDGKGVQDLMNPDVYWDVPAEDPRFDDQSPVQLPQPPAPDAPGEPAPQPDPVPAAPPVAPWQYPWVDPFTVIPVVSVPMPTPLPPPHWVIPDRQQNPGRSPSEQSQWGYDIPATPYELPTFSTEAGRGKNPDAGPRLEWKAGSKLSIGESTNERTRPRRNEKEKKIFVGISSRWAVTKVLSAVGEYKDAVKALYYAIPWEVRRKHKRTSAGELIDRSRVVWSEFDAIDWKKALIGLAVNEGIDRAMGVTGRANAKLARKTGATHGYQMGQRYWGTGRAVDIDWSNPWAFNRD